MPKSPSLRYHTLSVETDYLNEHRRRVPYETPRVVLFLVTEPGSVRSATMTRAQLINLIEKAAQALARIEPAP